MWNHYYLGKKNTVDSRRQKHLADGAASARVDEEDAADAESD